MVEGTTAVLRLGAASAASHIRAGNLSSHALTTACIARIAARDVDVKAWEHVDAEQVGLAVAEVDRRRSQSSLHGVPVAVKDVIDTVDMPTGYGTDFHCQYRPQADAACVARLREAGLVILGKTVTTEFAYLRPSKTRNPHDLSRTPGGSSSGSAAAVADFMAPIALGTQTVGSCIRPAAFCGVVGFKPTYGWTDMTGVRPLAQSFDTLSLFGRHVEDVQQLAKILARENILATSALPKSGLRIVLADIPALRARYPKPFEVYSKLEKRLSDAGIPVRRADLTPLFEPATLMHRTILTREAHQNLAAEVEIYGERIGPEIRGLVQLGAAVSENDYLGAQSSALSLRAEADKFFGDCDIVLMPSSAGAAPEIGAGTGDPAFNLFWSLLHTPCLTLPVGNDSGLPLGIQLIAKRGDDPILLLFAAALEWILQEAALKQQ